jgi:hypothetical protein
LTFEVLRLPLCPSGTHFCNAVVSVPASRETWIATDADAEAPLSLPNPPPAIESNHRNGLSSLHSHHGSIGLRSCSTTRLPPAPPQLPQHREATSASQAHAPPRPNRPRTSPSRHRSIARDNGGRSDACPLVFDAVACKDTASIQLQIAVTAEPVNHGQPLPGTSSMGAPSSKKLVMTTNQTPDNERNERRNPPEAAYMERLLWPRSSLAPRYVCNLIQYVT